MGKCGTATTISRLQERLCFRVFHIRTELGVLMKLVIFLKIFFYRCTVHSRYENFFIKIQLMHSL